MRTLLKWLVIVAVLAAVGGMGYGGLHAYWKARNAPDYRKAKVVRGEIIAVINATGTVNPVLSVRVGSFASGPVTQLLVDFNSNVRKGQLLAKIDPQLYESVTDREAASLEMAKADQCRIEELLKQAVAEEDRAIRLLKNSKDAISDSDMDKLHYTRTTLDAQLVQAKATIKQCQANLANAQANLGYCEIRSPVDGVIIDRKIDEGQTLAAQFQTPDLFVVAPDLKKEIHVYASVDEADIGLIRKAQGDGQPVFFTVDAYPDDLFEGKIYQIRMNSTTKENVVTYQVVVTTTNPDLKLLPGMTTKLSFQVDRREDATRIPNTALRFYPKKVELVRPEDRKLIEGSEEQEAEAESGDKSIDRRSAVQRSLAHRESSHRHVWVVEGEFLRAIPVVTGINDSEFTEMLSGDLQPDQELVTGTKTP
jgi:HlyD family secretion protein